MFRGAVVVSGKAGVPQYWIQLNREAILVPQGEKSVIHSVSIFDKDH